MRKLWVVEWRDVCTGQWRTLSSTYVGESRESGRYWLTKAREWLPKDRTRLRCYIPKETA